MQFAVSKRKTNNLYHGVPAYMMQEIHEKIWQRPLEDHRMDKEETRMGALRQVPLYENLSVQPISSDFPHRHTHRLPAIIFLILIWTSKHFHSFSYRKEWNEGHDFNNRLLMQLASESEQKIQTEVSEWVVSLQHISTKRLNLNYKFHCFHVHKISNMTHMLQSVIRHALWVQSFLNRLKLRVGIFLAHRIQTRGAPHIHCLLRIEDAPIIENNTNERWSRRCIHQPKSPLAKCPTPAALPCWVLWTQSYKHTSATSIARRPTKRTVNFTASVTLVFQDRRSRKHTWTVSSTACSRSEQAAQEASVSSMQDRAESQHQWLQPCFSPCKPG